MSNQKITTTKKNQQMVGQPASLTRRAIAAGVDWFIFSVCIYTNASINSNVNFTGDLLSFSNWLIPAALILYHPVLESSPLQGSLGKVFVRIKVEDLNHCRLKIGHALIRFFMKIIFTFATLGIAFYSAILSPRRKTLYDHLSKSQTVSIK